MTGPAVLYKYACDRDKILHAVVVDKTDGGEAKGGDLSAPTGRFTRLANGPTDPAALEARYPLLFDGVGFNRSELVGHFIVTELADGFVFVGEFQKAHQAEDEFEQLGRKYAKWQAAEKAKRDAADAANGVQRCANCAGKILSAEPQTFCVPCEDAQMAGAFDDDPPGFDQCRCGNPDCGAC